MVPACGVEDLPGELREPGYAGQARLRQRARRRDDNISGQVAAGGPQPPAGQVSVPAGPGDLGPEPQMAAQAVAVGDLFKVVPDLRLPGEAVGPAGVRRERERVQMGGDVAGAAGVGVVPPRAAHGGRPLQDEEVSHACLPQPDARAEPAEPGADDGDADMAGHGSDHFICPSMAGSAHATRRGACLHSFRDVVLTLSYDDKCVPMRSSAATCRDCLVRRRPRG